VPGAPAPTNALRHWRTVVSHFGCVRTLRHGATLLCLVTTMFSSIQSIRHDIALKDRHDTSEREDGAWPDVGQRTEPTIATIPGVSPCSGSCFHGFASDAGRSITRLRKLWAALESWVCQLLTGSRVARSVTLSSFDTWSRDGRAGACPTAFSQGRRGARACQDDATKSNLVPVQVTQGRHAGPAGTRSGSWQASRRPCRLALALDQRLDFATRVS
jgi:hypothetical protein